MGERLTGRGTAWVRLLAIVPLLAAGVAIGAPSPAAAATVCNTGDGHIAGETIEDAIVVETHTRCRLQVVTVRGGATIEPGGTFIAVGSEMRGSVSGTAVKTVNIETSVVRGGITVEGSVNAQQIFAMEVRGDVVLTGASGAAILWSATVRGSATLENNVKAYAIGNAIRQDLNCSGNGFVKNVDYLTNQVLPNSVAGARPGQCANL